MIAEVETPDDAPPDAARSSDTRRRWPAYVVPLVYLGLSMLAFATTSPLATDRLPLTGMGNAAASDPFQMTWFLAYTPYALTHGGSFGHTAIINYPTGINLGDNTIVSVLGILGWPITATLGPIATFNLLIRLAIFASATGMFFVLGRWCRTWSARFVGGLFYGFSPYMAAHSLHLDLAFVPIPPLVLLLADELVVRRKRSAVVLGLLIGLSLGIEYLISPDVLSETAVMIVVVGAFLAWRSRSELRPIAGRIATAGVMAFGVFAAIAGYFVYAAVAGVGHLTGPVIEERVLQSNSADLLGWVVPTPTQLPTPAVISHYGASMVAGNLSESGSYLGIALLVALVVVIRRFWHERTVRYFTFAALVATVLSLGGHLTVGTLHSPIPMPEDVLAHLPVLKDTIPARYSLFTVLFATILLGIGIDRIWLPALLAARRSAGRRPWWGEWRILGGGALVFASLIPNVPFPSSEVPWPINLPHTLAMVTPSGGVVAADPPVGLCHAAGMAWQAVEHDAFQLVGGYVNVMVPGMAYGSKGPVEPSFLSNPPLCPDDGSIGRNPSMHGATFVADADALRAYLAAHRVATFVYTGTNVPRDGYGMAHYDPNETLAPTGYAFVTRALGRPDIVAKGYVIWLVHGGWQRRPPPR